MLALTLADSPRQDLSHVDMPPVKQYDKDWDHLTPAKTFRLSRTCTIVRYLQVRPKPSNYYVLPLDSEDITCTRTAMYSLQLLEAVSTKLQLASDPDFAHLSIGEHEDDSKCRVLQMLRMQLKVIVRPTIDIVELRYSGRTKDCSRRIIDTLRICYLQEKDKPFHGREPLRSSPLRKKFKRGVLVAL